MRCKDFLGALKLTLIHIVALEWKEEVYVVVSFHVFGGWKKYICFNLVVEID